MRTRSGKITKTRTTYAKELFGNASALMNKCKSLDEFSASLRAAYTEFMVLKVLNKDTKLATLTLSPTGPVDQVWHKHMLCPQDYQDFCNRLCGHVIEHDPSTAENQALVRARQERAARERIKVGAAFGTSMFRQYWNIPKVAGKTYQIYVKSLTGKTYSLDVLDNWKIKDVKCEIQRRSGIPPDEQRLTFNTSQLLDDDTLGDLNVPIQATFFLVLRMRGC